MNTVYSRRRIYYSTNAGIHPIIDASKTYTRQAGLLFLSARLPDCECHNFTPQNTSFSFPSHLTCVDLPTLGSPLEYEMIGFGGLDRFKALQQRSSVLCLVSEDTSAEKAPL